MIRFRTFRATVFVLLLAGALGCAWWQHSLLVRTEVELARSRELVAELVRKPTALPSAAAVELLPAVAEPAVAKSPAPEERGGRGREGRFARVMADLSSDPEIGPLLLNQRKRAVTARYAALLARLGLPPAQAEQLKALLAEKQISHSDAQSMARGQGLGREEAQAVAKQADAESDAAIKALLGNNGFAQLQEFDRTSAQRSTVGSLAERLSYAGAPLPAAQQEQLIQILASNAPPMSGGRGGDQGGGAAFGAAGPGGRLGTRMAFLGGDISDAEARSYADQKAASDAVVLQQASAILTPAQVAALQQMQQEENEQVRLNTLMRRRLRQARSEGGG